MRWSTSFGLSVLSQVYSTAAAKLSQPVVYNYDATPLSSTSIWTSEAVDPATARLIFAQRLGLSEYHTLGDADDDALRQINAYSASLKRFPWLAEERPAIFAVIEGVREVPDDLSRIQRQDRDDGIFLNFTMAESPAISETSLLWETLYSQAKDKHASGTLRIPQILEDSCEDRRWRHAANVAFEYARCSYTTEQSQGALARLHEAASEYEATLTVVMMPQRPTKPSKKNKRSPYGILDSPKKALNKREEVLKSESTSSSSAVVEATTGSQSQVQATSPAYPFVPQCFTSASDCMSATKNCTGHGECVVKAGSTSPSKAGDGDACYACSCNKPEVVKNDDGSTKTTYFGGSACHKKDISQPFWILTLTGGSLVALVGFGIGMLYSMGQAELPSVIGAGVSGPRAK